MTPHVQMMTSVLAAMREFADEGRSGPGDHTMVGQAIRRSDLQTVEGFQEFVAALCQKAPAADARASDTVPATTLWWVDGEQFLGRITIRHRLTEELRVFGGHIGYDIRSSARGRGHATAMLREALPVAFGLGIDPALLTCAVTNTASRRVIERNGGVLQGLHDDRLLYWITAPIGSSTLEDPHLRT